jgi:hypothetical protein
MPQSRSSGQTIAGTNEQIVAQYGKALKQIRDTFSACAVTATFYSSQTMWIRMRPNGTAVAQGQIAQTAQPDPVVLERNGYGTERVVFPATGAMVNVTKVRNPQYYFTIHEGTNNSYKIDEVMHSYDFPVFGRRDDWAFSLLDAALLNDEANGPMWEFFTDPSRGLDVQKITTLNRDGKSLLKIEFITDRPVSTQYWDKAKFYARPGTYVLVSPSEGWALYEFNYVSGSKSGGVEGETVGESLTRDRGTRSVKTVEYDGTQYNGVFIPKKIIDEVHPMFQPQAGMAMVSPLVRKELVIKEVSFKKPKSDVFYLPHYGLKVPEIPDRTIQPESSLTHAPYLPQERVPVSRWAIPLVVVVVGAGGCWFLTRRILRASKS